MTDDINMGRKASSSGFRRPSPSGPSRSAHAAAAPPQAPRAAPVQSQPSGGIMSGLGGTLMSGMAFGAGSEIAHQAVRGIIGSGSGSGHSENHSAPQTQQDRCYEQNQNFMNCLQFNNNDISMCQSYLDLFKQCKNQY